MIYRKKMHEGCIDAAAHNAVLPLHLSALAITSPR